MTMRISLVGENQVAGVIPAILPYLRMSEAQAYGRATADDILRFILTGRMNLWVIHDERGIYAYVATEIKQYPQCKMLEFQYCAGQTGVLEQIEEQMHELMERFAKDAGCAGIEFFGRPGWRNNARKHNYDVRSVVYQKFFGVNYE